MTIKFEDVLRDYEELARQSEDFAKARKAKVDESICKLLLNRYPNADPNMTVAEVVGDETVMAEIVREAEALADAFMKSQIEEGARKVYRRLVSAPEPPATKQ
jgi:hypothetical protein